MLILRSFVFLLLQLLLTPIFSTLAILTFPFSPLTRYRLISSYARTMIWLLKIVCGIRHQVIGIENIPKNPCIVLCKHQSAWETLALQAIFPPQAWVLKRELLWIPFFGWGLAMTSPIAIDRRNGKGAVKQLLKLGQERLAQGFFVVIFPEGTRIPYGARGKYKMGGALLAASSGTPVVPVAHNAGRFWGRNAFSKHPGLITMSIGVPIVTQGLKADEINRLTEAWIESEIQQWAH
ncbi:MAG: lysophospholipid acyltransferase family protein [Gallionella sp.]